MTILLQNRSLFISFPFLSREDGEVSVPSHSLEGMERNDFHCFRHITIPLQIEWRGEHPMREQIGFHPIATPLWVEWRGGHVISILLQIVYYLEPILITWPSLHSIIRRIVIRYKEDGMDTAPLYLKKHGDGMIALPSLYMGIGMGRSPLHAV